MGAVAPTGPPLTYRPPRRTSNRSVWSVVPSTAAAPGERGRVVGIWAGVGAIGSAAGPLLAGALEALGSWRLFFLIDVPFALVVLWFLRHARDADRSGAPAAVDLVSVACLTLGLGGAVLALLAGPDSGWLSVPVVGGAVAAVVLLVKFAVRDAHAPRPRLHRSLTHFQPLLDRLLAVDRHGRFQSANELLAALAAKPFSLAY